MHIRQGKLDEFYARNHLKKSPEDRLELVFNLRRIGANTRKITALKQQKTTKN